MSPQPLLIAITGPDGSGKSTACSRVRELLAERLGTRVVEVSVWDALAEHGDVAPVFKGRAEAERYLADLDGVSRALFIFHAMARAVQLARQSKPSVMLLNGYWYKYAVSEIGYGVDPDFVLGATLGFALPAHVFCLDIDPETAWERRRRATAYEQGGSFGAASERERFMGFQGRLRQAWSAIEAQTGLHWEHLSALAPAEEIAQEISSGILLRLGKVEA
jgi:thymidylate kinase